MKIAGRFSVIVRLLTRPGNYKVSPRFSVHVHPRITSAVCERERNISHPSSTCMAAENNLDTEVLIIGAGPTGLVLALWLKRLGVHVRIFDKASAPGTTSRALAVQARTLEFYGQLGFANEVVRLGRWAIGGTIWSKGRRAAHIDFKEMGSGISPYPYALIFPQDQHERLLIDRLSQLGAFVERGKELLELEECDDRVRVKIRNSDGTEEICTTAYLAGCDGARSIIRKQLNIGFPGGTYEHLFYVADVEATGETLNGGLNIVFEQADFLVVFPLKDDGQVRFIGTVRDTSVGEDNLSWASVDQGIITDLRTDVERVNWFSTYRVHHRVADHFRKGRSFLLGDAAHIHSPVGGQGMNTGIGDAVNLAWKLAAVLRGKAKVEVLDSYELERIAFARRLVATTDRAFTTVTSGSPLARLMRLRIVPLVAALPFSSRRLRRLLFRTISQVGVNYRHSTLSRGRTGAVHAGDRLPWVKQATHDANGDNFAPLQSLNWQLHVYGSATPQLCSLSAGWNLPMHVFPWNAEMKQKGLERDAIYLVRPDGYIAVAAGPNESETLETYLAEIMLSVDNAKTSLPGHESSSHSEAR
jgi:2-polyprenyl-6-methoxyphenol hydroxylase-like FAD-dependent oxidoreductase